VTEAQRPSGPDISGCDRGRAFMRQHGTAWTDNFVGRALAKHQRLVRRCVLPLTREGLGRWGVNPVHAGRRAGIMSSAGRRTLTTAVSQCGPATGYSAGESNQGC